MQRKLIAILFSIIVILVSAGCSTGGVNPKKPTGDFRVGSEGLAIRFARLPARIYAEDSNYDDHEFLVDVEVLNKGAFPQPDSETLRGDIYLSGFDSAIITMDSANAHKALDSNNLGGKSSTNKEGSRDLISFYSDINLGDRQIDSFKPTIMATACYEYMTTGNIPVCIDSDPYKITAGKKVCTVPSSYTVGGGTQGAPVAISKVEEEVMSNRIQFRIHIRNVGKGDVIDSNYLQDCNPYYSSSLSVSNTDRVYLDTAQISNADITYNCRPKDRIIRLYNGEGVIYCDFTSSDGFDKQMPAYTSPLLIKLRYVYRSTISQPVEIIRIK